jgi:hypothetical protein
MTARGISGWGWGWGTCVRERPLGGARPGAHARHQPHTGIAITVYLDRQTGQWMGCLDEASPAVLEAALLLHGNLLIPLGYDDRTSALAVLGRLRRSPNTRHNRYTLLDELPGE